MGFLKMIDFMSTKICFLSFCFLLCCTIEIKAQKTHIVVFDCTQSMIHPKGFWGKENIDSTMWKAAKQNIKSVYETMVEKNDRFVLLLFQSEIIDTFDRVKQSDNDWAIINSKMERALEQGGNTCILNAWNHAERYFTSNTNFYLITDGIEDHDDDGRIGKLEQEHINLICNRINSICGHQKGIQGFYTNLKEEENSLKCKDISETLENSCFKRPIVGIISPKEISLDENDIKRKSKAFVLSFERPDGKIVNLNGIHASFYSDSELLSPENYFEVKVDSNCIKQNKLCLKVNIIDDVPVQLLKRDNNNKPFCKFNVVIESDSIEKECIYPQKVGITAHYFIEKVAFISSELKEGSSSYHPPFFIKSLARRFEKYDWVSEHKPDTIVFDLKETKVGCLFNSEALRFGNSLVTLRLSPVTEADSTKSDFILLFNDKLCENNQFSINTSDSVAFLKIVFDKCSGEGSFNFRLLAVKICDLDKINDCNNTNDYSLPVILTFNKDFNLLNIVFFILAVIVILALFIRFFYVRRPNAIMNDYLYYVLNDDEGLLINLEKCTRGIISNNSQKRQGIISWLFNGVFCYSKPIEEIEEEIIVTANGCDDYGNHSLKFSSSGDYKINGISLSDYPPINKDTSKEYVITKNSRIMLTIKYF